MISSFVWDLIPRAIEIYRHHHDYYYEPALNVKTLYFLPMVEMALLCLLVPTVTIISDCCHRQNLMEEQHIVTIPFYRLGAYCRRIVCCSRTAFYTFYPSVYRFVNAGSCHQKFIHRSTIWFFAMSGWLRECYFVLSIESLWVILKSFFLMISFLSHSVHNIVYKISFPQLYVCCDYSLNLCYTRKRMKVALQCHMSNVVNNFYIKAKC